MANEFVHASAGAVLTQAEYESITGHVFNSQATGDILYASSATQLSRLGITANRILGVSGGVPVWTNSLPFIGVANNAASATAWIFGSESWVHPTESVFGITLNPYLQETIADNTNMLCVGDFYASLGSLNTKNWTNVAALRAVTGYIHLDLGATGIVTGGMSFYAHANVNAATLTSWYGYYADDPTGSGTLIKAYGIYIATISKGATLNYGIYIVSNDCYFGGTVTTGGIIDITGHDLDNAGNIDGATAVLIRGAGTANYVQLQGGAEAAGGGAIIAVRGNTGAGAAGGIDLYTPNAAKNDSISRLSISGNLAVAVASWINCKQVYDATSLPNGDPAVAGQLYYLSATGVVMRSAG